MSDESREMPKYQCHKQVWALKIKDINAKSGNDIGYVITPEEGGYGDIEISIEWYVTHKPLSGGYYVVYEGGYSSYSPADAFESGYRKV